MEKQLFQKSKKVITKPYKNLGQMKEIWSKTAKGPPKTLEKHQASTINDMSFLHVAKPYKTHGKLMI